MTCFETNFGTLSFVGLIPDINLDAAKHLILRTWVNRLERLRGAPLIE
jgi:hypothetical protein